MSRYELFDRSKLQLLPIEQRGHDLQVEQVRRLESPTAPFTAPGFSELLDAIRAARQAQHPVVLMMGAHPIKLGLSRYLCDLIERGWVTHLAVNGAGVIHDFELAAVGGTSENVARWIQVGQFGLWSQTSVLNEAIRSAAARGEGLAEGVGRFIEQHELPHRDLSLAATAWRCGVPMTCHVSVGSDIIHSHASCDGAALGQASYTDFLIFAQSIRQLEGGVYLNIGTAVTGPEVYLKALSMARNVARQQGDTIRDFTTAVFDLIPVPPGYHIGPPPKDHPMYYYRPWKTILVRTVADGGKSYYFCGDHQNTIPSLWQELHAAKKIELAA
ncbi:MAG: hypothetical protein U0795_14720 [Pirellulales bacterium]